MFRSIGGWRVAGLFVARSKRIASLDPFAFDQCLNSGMKSRQFLSNAAKAEARMLLFYPRTVRQSGFNIICTNDVTISVESRPLPPLTSTGLPS